MQPKVPDRLYVDKGDKALYEKLKEEALFRAKENRDLFLIAMVYGFKNNVRRRIETREGYVRAEYLNPDDWALIHSIVMANEPIGSIEDREKVFHMAEEFAHAGVRLLADAIDSVPIGSFDKWFEKQVSDSYKEAVKSA